MCRDKHPLIQRGVERQENRHICFILHDTMVIYASAMCIHKQTVCGCSAYRHHTPVRFDKLPLYFVSQPVGKVHQPFRWHSVEWNRKRPLSAFICLVDYRERACSPISFHHYIGRYLKQRKSLLFCFISDIHLLWLVCSTNMCIRKLFLCFITYCKQCLPFSCHNTKPTSNSTLEIY